jgi:hypothetical protein
MEPQQANMANMANLMMIWAMMFAAFWLIVFVLPHFFMRKAVLQILRVFKKNHSLCSESPKTPAELDLRPERFIGRFSRGAYTLYALQLLIKAGVVRSTDDGKLCLLEENVPSEFLRES